MRIGRSFRVREVELDHYLDERHTRAGSTRPRCARRGADTIFFLSDYGRSDEFVGVVHAVLRRLAPRPPQ